MLLRIVGAGLAAYLLGSVPPGIFWGWLIGRIDVRLQGSGRTGGTNVWRAAGFSAAVLTALSDALKGAAAIWMAEVMGVPVWGVALVGALAIVGHNYSILLGFRGGAGTATSIGVAAALWTMSLAILPVTLVAVGLLVGHASVASIFFPGPLGRAQIYQSPLPLNAKPTRYFAVGSGTWKVVRKHAARTRSCCISRSPCIFPGRYILPTISGSFWRGQALGSKPVPIQPAGGGGEWT